MTEKSNKPKAPISLAERLANEAGITEKQATMLIAVLGAQSWSSLLREARVLNGKP
jgi:hypothetical protein